mgnify:FL=1
MIHQQVRTLMRRLKRRIVSPPGDGQEKLIDKVHALNVLSLVVDRLAARNSTLFFIQIGANDGLQDDDLRPLILRHRMAGILVEPNPVVFERLQRNYTNQPQLIFENVAIAENCDSITLYMHDPDGPAPQEADVFTSVHRELVERIRYDDVPPCLRQIKVPAISYDTLLRSHNVERLDLLYIDTEGMDQHILSMVTHSLHRPAIIHFEHLHMPHEVLKSQVEVLASQGYQLIKLPWDVLAVHPDSL